MPKRTRKTLTAAERLLRSDGALCVTFVNAGVAGLAAEQPGKAADAVRRAQTLRIRGPLSPDILTSRGFGAF